MNHQERHRGPHPKDDELFSEQECPKLVSAIHDYCWLLTKGYAQKSSLKLVGDKHLLRERQRRVLMRSACSDQQQSNRCQKSVPAQSIANQELYVDGLNILITIETALSNGFIFIGRDGCYRDLSSIHGTYKRVVETKDAILFIGKSLEFLGVSKTTWHLDQPVSNSKRLKGTLDQMATEFGWNWQVELSRSPDAELKKANGLTVTTDSVILDSVDQWFNLGQFTIQRFVPTARIVDLSTR